MMAIDAHSGQSSESGDTKDSDVDEHGSRGGGGCGGYGRGRGGCGLDGRGCGGRGRGGHGRGGLGRGGGQAAQSSLQLHGSVWIKKRSFRISMLITNTLKIQD